MEGMFFFQATGLILLSINEILLFTNRISIESFSRWMLNIGMGEIWKWHWWFLSFIANEPLLRWCNLSTLPNSRSSRLRLASLQCLKRYVIEPPILQQWNLSQTPISEVGTAPHPLSWAGLSTELQFLNKGGRISQRGKWGGGLGDVIERYDMQVPEYQRACYSIENPLC